jgi:nucleoid-associated protein YgaU
MQPIERYGVAALLFLIATIGAVVLWDQSETEVLPDKEVVAANEKPVKKKASQNTHQSPKDIANNLLAAIDPKKPAGKTGRIHLGGKPAANGNPGTGGNQSGGMANTNNDSWARGSKSPMTIPLGQIAKGPKQQAKAPLSAAEIEIANRKNPNGKNMGTAGLIELDRNKQVRNDGANNQKRSDGRTYKITPGDTLGGIAVSELGGYSKLGALLKANPGMTAESALSVGKVINIPDLGQGAASGKVADALFKSNPSAKPSNAAAPKSGRSYTVAEGDSLWKIASSQLGDGIRHAEIKKLNGFLTSDQLSVGMVLALPSGASTSVAQNTKSKPATTTPKSSFKPGVIR